MFQQYNANPVQKQVGDCVIRAISKALDQNWYKTYAQMYIDGLTMCDMPSANYVWGSYLRRKGFRRRLIPDECPDCYTVKDFCRDNPVGTFILAMDGHVVTVVNGCYFDTWDSGNEIPIYYWYREE